LYLLNQTGEMKVKELKKKAVIIITQNNITTWQE